MDDVRSLELLHYYVSLEADITENDMVTAQLIDASRKKCQRRIRRFWQRNWLERRPLHGQYERLMAELKEEDIASFRNFVRMGPQKTALVREEGGNGR